MSSVFLAKKCVRGRLLLLAVGLFTLVLAGCERRERVIDVKTPGGGITVDKVERLDNGADRVEVNVDE